MLNRIRASREANDRTGRMAKPEGLTGLVRFLVSDNSSYITGPQIVIEGGDTFIYRAGINARSQTVVHGA